MIARTVVTGLFAGCLSLVAVPAEAQLPGPVTGRACSFVGYSVYTSPIDYVVINGGPLAAAAQGATISLRCTLQVGWANAAHAGADAVSVSSAPDSTRVTAVPPTPANYAIPGDAPYFLCTEATVDGTTYFRNGWDTTWSTNSGTPCSLGGCPQSTCLGPGLLVPLFDLVYSILDQLLDSYDATVCPVTGSLAPGVPGVAITSEGDVSWTDDDTSLDCPPDD